MKATATYGKSLYYGGEEANGFEYDIVLALTGVENAMVAQEYAPQWICGQRV